MKRIFVFLLLVFFFLTPAPAFAQEKLPPPQPNQQYFLGTVVSIQKEENTKKAGYNNFTQTLSVEITENNTKKTITVTQGGIIKVTPQQKLTKGDKVIIIKTSSGKNTVYSILDRYRLKTVTYILIAFFALVIFISGKKGLGSMIGLVVSVLVILKFIVPQILDGKDPLTISIVGSLLILTTTIYLAHGFSKKITVAVVSTGISLLLTGLLSVLFVKLAHLSGLGNENTYLLQFGPTNINLQGILLGGMIIGALGVLDDITTTQSAAIFELAKTDPKLTSEQLFAKGFAIGKEHVSSLVNTLVLAYAGTALGLFVIFVLNPANQPYWVILNSEVITEEVIRTLAGSIGLILAVPITTFFASFIAGKKK